MSIDIRETFWDFCNSYSGLRLSFPNSSKANVLALRELDVLQRDFPDVHLVRGNVLMHLDRRQEALGEFDMFVREAPSDSRGDRIQQIVAAVRQAASQTNSVQP